MVQQAIDALQDSAGKEEQTGGSPGIMSKLPFGHPTVDVEDTEGMDLSKLCPMKWG